MNSKLNPASETISMVKAADCVVVFKGLHLEIETYTQDVLKITGQIQSVEFLCC